MIEATADLRVVVYYSGSITPEEIEEIVAELKPEEYSDRFEFWMVFYGRSRQKLLSATKAAVRRAKATTRRLQVCPICHKRDVHRLKPGQECQACEEAEDDLDIIVEATPPRN